MNTQHQHPLVSIIIPTFNRAHLIGETLDSVLAQTYQNWECIIVDDGSSDNTDEVVGNYVKKDPRFKYYHRPDTHKPGGNGARNYGFEVSEGEYVNWFDDDDLMHPYKIVKQLTAIVNSNFNFSVCQTLVFEDDKENILGLRHEKIISDNPLVDFICSDIVFLTQTPIFKTDFLKERNLKFDEELKAAQEWEFICRVLCFSPNYHADDRPFVYIRKHKESITYNNDYLKREYFYLQARIKIFHLLKSKGNIQKDKKLYFFFKNYFIEKYKKILFFERKQALTIYRRTLKHFHNYYQRIVTISYIKFVLYTGKGYNYRDNFIK